MIPGFNNYTYVLRLVLAGWEAEVRVGRLLEGDEHGAW